MKKTITALLSLVIFLFHAYGACAEEEISDVHIAIKGGISLGSYESGLNWMLLKKLKDNQENKNLVSFAGASAGSINSLISAIDYCSSSDGNNNYFNNIFKDSWDIGLEDLLNGNNENSKDVALFSRTGLEKTVAEINNKIDKSEFETGCNPPTITMSITRFNPYKAEIRDSAQTINLQRFVVPIDVSINDAGKLVFKNTEITPISKPRYPTPLPYLKLPVDNPETGDIDFKTIKKLAFASSAFPIAFAPVSLSHCLTYFDPPYKQQPQCTDGLAERALFSDGGLFDNSPIGVSRDIIATRDSSKDQIVFYINPDNYRIKYDVPVTQEENRGVTGIADYSQYLFSGFDTATSEELRQALIAFDKESAEKGNDKSKSVKKLIISDRYHNLLADFNFHFGAFYAKEFREHDYLVGLYDGAQLYAQLECRSEENKDVKYYCRKNKVLDWIENDLPEMPEAPAQVEQELKPNRYTQFIKYLYNTEYNAALALGDDDNANIYIALAETFDSQYKDKNITMSLSDYLEKLNILLNGDKFTGLNQLKNDDPQKQAEVLNIAANYHEWRTKNYELLFDGLQKMQKKAGECDTCDNGELNSGIKSLLDHAEPIASSYFSQMRTGVWPFAKHPLFKSDNLSASLLYGFDFLEVAQQLSGRARYSWRRKCSLDFDVSYHFFSSDQESDHYVSTSLGATYHRNNIVWSTVGGGYEHAFPGRKIYKESLPSVYLSFGFFEEIISLRIVRRINAIDESYSPSTRADWGGTIQLDAGKIIDIAN